MISTVRICKHSKVAGKVTSGCIIMQTKTHASHKNLDTIFKMEYNERYVISIDFWSNLNEIISDVRICEEIVPSYHTKNADRVNVKFILTPDMICSKSSIEAYIPLVIHINFKSGKMYELTLLTQFFDNNRNFARSLNKYNRVLERVMAINRLDDAGILYKPVELILPF